MNQLTAWAEAHHLLLLLALGTAGSALWLLLLRKRLKIPWYAAILLAIVHTLYGLFTVKSFAFLETGFAAGSFGGMSLFGAVAFMPLAYYLGAKIARQDVATVFDIFTPCLVATLFCARVNCILAGCCYGILIPGMNSVRFPTRELELVFYAVLLAILCPRIYKGKTRGEVYPVYMICYGAFRFITEFFRASDSGALFHIAHIWALVTLFLGISIYAEIYHPQKSKKRGRNK